ncbi:MAG: hypothetical protein FD187_2212 [bacterium]|nr:MAG: hypothetical protein FD142_2587 [bacterium]KAF0148101.1 MAG: hypothetical protein FD187_2212 [bacterium]KAF0167633.1 MAG: hypothetical protein FD158_2109 [bacterium]TXT19457.1 MAG: hypothetical protein FD132_1726 [bacterium]
MTVDPQHPGGQGSSLRALLIQVLSLFATRGELAVLELADARDRVLRWLAFGMLAAILLLAALLTFSIWVAALFWEGPRGLALGLLALVYLLGGGILLGVIAREVAKAPVLLAQTRAELEKDHEALRAHLGGADDGPG